MGLGYNRREEEIMNSLIKMTTVRRRVAVLTLLSFIALC